MTEPSSKQKLRKIAEHTADIIEKEKLPSGFSIRDALRYCVNNTHVIDPIELVDAFWGTEPADNWETIVEVTSETTVEATERLYHERQTTSGVFVLNFASAKHPGGGWLKGARAQEESIARASGLYASLTSGPAEEFYKKNKKCGTALYTDLMIYSGQVPFFKDDAGLCLETPFYASVLTVPAPNAGVVEKAAEVAEIGTTLERRINNILAVAEMQGHEDLVLGAWGCGVFGNDPEDVAVIFKECLDGPFKNVFRKVTFAVLDKTDVFSKILCDGPNS